MTSYFIQKILKNLKNCEILLRLHFLHLFHPRVLYIGKLSWCGVRRLAMAEQIKNYSRGQHESLSASQGGHTGTELPPAPGLMKTGWEPGTPANKKHLKQKINQDLF